MTTYTYEVDHGDDAPAITAGMEINGGKLVAVQFDAALSKLEILEAELNDLKSESASRESYEIEQQERS